MRRITSLLVVLAPGLAVADNRLDLEPIPSLDLLEPVHHLDRGTDWDRRSTGGVFATIGVGYGSHAGDKGLVGEGALAIGKRMKHLVVAANSELVAAGNELVRGRHAGYLELRTDDRRSDDDLSGRLTINAALEHGEARALAPVFLGPGRRNHGAASAEAAIGIDPDKDEMIWSAIVEADGSLTRWLDAPLLDEAQRGAFGLGLAFIPNDGEIPRGRFDILRARVEHANIMFDPVAQRAAGIPVRDTQVRTIEVMTGPKEFAGYIDHEVLLAVTAQFGAAWMESDATAGRIADTMFKMDLGWHFKWLKKRRNVREVGFALARQPGSTPDGQHHVSDWRLELVSGAEDRHFVLAARGGISWVTHIAGGDRDPDTVKRYGSHVEAFAKLGLGLELGGYHAMSYEPRMAGDPWSSPREFATEVGALLRWRGDTTGLGAKTRDKQPQPMIQAQ